MPQIRFSQMHGTQLLAVEESPIGLHFKDVIRSYLSDAYRLLVFEQFNVVTEFYKVTFEKIDFMS